MKDYGLRVRGASTHAMVVGVLVLSACAALMAVKGIGDRAASNEAALLRVVAEARSQDALEWQAISTGEVGNLDEQHSASVKTARSLLRSASLDTTTENRLLSRLLIYANAVDREFQLLAEGSTEQAEGWDETQVDPAADDLLEDLDVVASRMASARRAASVWTTVGLLATLVLALGLMGLLRRRQLTDRARHQQELLSEARYRAIIDRSSDLLLVCDVHGDHTYLSPAAERLFGRVSGARLSLHDSVDSDDQDSLRDLLADAVREGEAGPTDLAFPSSDGLSGWRVYQFWARDLSHIPSVAGIVLTGQEVTRARQLEQAKSDFLGNVSHELRTPLASIAMYLELLREGEFGPLHDEQLVPMAAVERNSHRLQGLLEELLFVSGFHSAAPQAEPRCVDLVDIVELAVVDARILHPQRTIDLELPATSRHVPVFGVSDDLERVTANLLVNALKFSAEEDKVTITLAADSGCAQIVVTDHGIGIPYDEQHQLFERFFRSSLARHRAISGTGLGLAICKAVVEEHSGSISIDSEVGRGTSVLVRLPVATSAPVSV